MDDAFAAAPPAQRLLHVVADRQRWHAALALARAALSGAETVSPGRRRW
jgi:hypothetical protein